MPNLIYINNKINLDHFEQVLNVKFNTIFKNYNILSTKVWYEMHFPQSRTSNSALWDMHLLPQYQIPTYDSMFSKDFKTITDERAVELEKFHEQTGRPIVINWSGGIDSTCAVAAAYKNFKPSTKKNTTVLLNNFSYFENPVFFNRVIKPSFNYARVESHQADPWANAIVVNGEPADAMWIHADILELIHRYPGANSTSITNTDVLLEFLASKSDPSHAKWFYKTIMDSSVNSPAPIETYEDFYWWTNFNFYMPGTALKPYILDATVYNQENFNMFQQFFVPWFLTDDYQKWSMVNNNNGVKIGNTIQSYKLPAKQYILEADNNPYYYHYKTKTGSFKQYNSNEYKLLNIIKKVFAVYDNGTIVKIADPECRSMLLTNQQLLE